MPRFYHIAIMLSVLFYGCAMQPSDKEMIMESKDTLNIKVMVINYDPIIKSEGNRRLHEVCKWNDPHVLAKGYANDLKECSGRYANFQIVEWVDADFFPAKLDGFQYTVESYMECYRKWSGWHEPDGVDYKAIIADYKLDKRVENGEIDEVWLFGAPFLGFWESTMAGEGSYFCNSSPVPDVNCSKIFIIMGFNYERGVGEMLEDFGHRTESIMWHVFGSWEPKETHAWNKFTLYDKVAPNKSACGNVHFAPNSTSDYEWGNKTEVWSSCDDWLDYPNLTGKKRIVSSNEWGNGDIREHHKWWFRHLPKANGTTDGKLNNWWRYIIDFNSYPESRK